MSSTPIRTQMRQEDGGVLGRPGGVGIDPEWAGVDLAHGLERFEIGRATELDLERREVRRSSGALSDDGGLVDAEAEVGRQQLAGRAEELRQRQAKPLAGQVVESEVDQAFGGAVVGDALIHRRRGIDQPATNEVKPVRHAPAPRRPRPARARRPRPSPASRHRTDPGSPRRRPSTRRCPSGPDDGRGITIRRRPRDPEGVPERQGEDLGRDPHGRATTAIGRSRQSLAQRVEQALATEPVRDRRTAGRARRPCARSRVARRSRRGATC